MVETKKATPATPATPAKHVTPAGSASAAAPAKPGPARKTQAQIDAEAKAASEESAKVDAEAQAKVARINANLAKDGSTRRIMAGPRRGKAKHFWANMVPTQELTDEELKAVEAM